MSPRVRRGAAVAALAAATAATGCGEDRGPRVTAPQIPADCTKALPVRTAPMPPSFPLPGGTVVAEPAEGDASLRQVRGFVTRLPGAAVEDVIARGAGRVILQEDDGHDAEVSIADGKRRTFYKFSQVCATGSRFTAQQVPEP